MRSAGIDASFFVHTGDTAGLSVAGCFGGLVCMCLAYQNVGRGGIKYLWCFNSSRREP